MRGRCEDCEHFDGKYCCSGFIEDEDVTIKEIGKRVREAEGETELLKNNSIGRNYND